MRRITSPPPGGFHPDGGWVLAMGRMSLGEAIDRLDELDNDATIYASRPFSLGSFAVIAVEPDSGDLPGEAASLGLSYFLEVAIAREVLEGLERISDRHSTPEERRARVLEYAIDDA